jgi:hypothetical protein
MLRRVSSPDDRTRPLGSPPPGSPGYRERAGQGPPGGAPPTGTPWRVPEGVDPPPGTIEHEVQRARKWAQAAAALAALATALASLGTLTVIRKLNARWARARLGALARGSHRTVMGLQVFGLTADLVRGGVLTYGMLLVLHPLFHLAIANWGLDARLSRAVVSGIAAMVAGGAAWKIFHTTPGARWFFLGGLAGGLALLVLT